MLLGEDVLRSSRRTAPTRSAGRSATGTQGRRRVVDLEEVGQVDEQVGEHREHREPETDREPQHRQLRLELARQAQGEVLGAVVLDRSRARGARGVPRPARRPVRPLRDRLRAGDLHAAGARVPVADRPALLVGAVAPGGPDAHPRRGARPPPPAVPRAAGARAPEIMRRISPSQSTLRYARRGVSDLGLRR